LKQLFSQYNLIYNGDPTSKDNDVFKHRHFTIITRSGIEKIQKGANIKIKYTPVFTDANNMVIHAKGYIESIANGSPLVEIETFASASDKTSTSAYYAEMAEKRAMSRIVLKLAGLYELGVFGQDEIDEEAQDKFKAKQGAVYKGG
jgi:hypothetical protein